MKANIRSNMSILTSVVGLGILLSVFSSQALGQVNISSSKNNSTMAAPAVSTPNRGNLPNEAGNPALPNITGSIPLGSTISGAIFSKVKTSLNDAVTIAQKSVGSNTSATLAFLRPLEGYLVYDIHVRNNSNNTTSAVIVDAGNGKVLYKQTPPSLMFGLGNYPSGGGMFGRGGTEKEFGYHSGMTMGAPSSNIGPMGSNPGR